MGLLLLVFIWVLDLFVFIWVLDLFVFKLIAWCLIKFILLTWILNILFLRLSWNIIFIVCILFKSTCSLNYWLKKTLFLINRFLSFNLLRIIWLLFWFRLRNNFSFRIILICLTIWSFLVFLLISRSLHLFDSILDLIIKLFSRIPNARIIILTLILVYLFVFFFLNYFTILLLFLLILLWTCILRVIRQLTSFSGSLNILLFFIFLGSLLNILLIRWLNRLAIIIIANWLLISLHRVLLIIILNCLWWRGKKEGYNTTTHLKFII